LGTWAQSQSVTGLVVLYAIGIVGYVMRRFDIPVGPAVVGTILGPEAETHFRRAMQISQGDASVFITRPIAGSIFTVAILLFMGPRLWTWIRDYRRARRSGLAA
jgi:putative tricarboxylic transport membrane protein